MATLLKSHISLTEINKRREMGL